MTWTKNTFTNQGKLFTKQKVFPSAFKKIRWFSKKSKPNPKLRNQGKIFVGLRIKSVVSTNHRFYFGNRRHVKNQFWYLENRFYIRCWLLKTSRKTQKRGRAPQNFPINQGSFGEILRTGGNPMQHHKPLKEFNKPIS